MISKNKETVLIISYKMKKHHLVNLNMINNSLNGNDLLTLLIYVDE